MFDPRMLRIFHNGENVHERLSQYFHNSNVTFLEEEEIPRDILDVHGRCDGIAMHEGTFVVVEFKSINARKVYKAKEEHEGQIMWYMHMWETHRQKLLDGKKWDLSPVEKLLLSSKGSVKGEIIMESKQTQELFTFPMTLDTELIAKIRKWFIELQAHVDEKRIPPIIYNEKKFPCQWTGGRCAYWEKCHGDKVSTNML